MRFEQGVVKQVMHAAFRWYGFYNLPRHMVEHWTCVHEFNRLLVIWLNYKEMDKRVQRRILNPRATPFTQSNQEEAENTIIVENTFKEEKKVPTLSDDLEKEKIGLQQEECFVATGVALKIVQVDVRTCVASSLSW